MISIFYNCSYCEYNLNRHKYDNLKNTYSK